MLYRQKKDTYIRNYDGIGYIRSTGLFNDRVVNESGTVFLTALSRKARSLDELIEKVLPVFTDTDRETLLKDGKEFYDALVEDGFLVSGETEEELDRNDIGFSYKSLDPKTAKKDFTPTIRRADTDTQTYLENHFRGKPHLSSFQIELTSRCNERCVHCYIPHKYKLYDIKPELYYSVLEKKYDFYVNILSNLTLLNDEIIAEMKAGNVSSVQVSLYSMIPEHHDAITKLPGSFEKTKNAILKLIENDIPLQISCPTMKGNKNDYNDVLKWAHDHKVRAVTDYIMMAEYNHETENLANRLSVEEAGKVIEDILKDDIDYQQEILKPDFPQRCKEIQFNPERQLCGVGISSCCMVANGNVYPCAGWQEMVLGNVKDEPLEKIWNESPKIQYLRGLKMKDMGNGECCRCDKAAFCAPCMVRNANESPTGNPLEINRHFCAVAAKNKQLVLEWRERQLSGQDFPRSV